MYWLIYSQGDIIINAFEIILTDPYSLRDLLETNFKGDLNYRNGFRLTLHPQKQGNTISTLWTIYGYDEAHINDIIKSIQDSRYATYCKRNNVDNVPEWIYNQLDAKWNYSIKTYEDRLVYSRGKNILNYNEKPIQSQWCCYKW